MQLIKSIRPEFIVGIGLGAVAVAHWGENVFYTQVFIMCAFAMAAISVMSRDWIIGVFGVYISIWLIVLHVAAALGKIPQEAILQVIDTQAWIMAGFLIYTIVRLGNAPLNFYLNVICAVAIGLSTVGLIQHFVLGVPASATTGNQNYLAAFLAISGPAFIRPRWWVFLIPVSACLVVAQTSTAMAAFFIGCGIRLIGWWSIPISVSAGVYYFIMVDANPASLAERMSQWIDAIAKISGSWTTILFGAGPAIHWNWSQLHSEYVSIYWYFGLVGVALVTCYIIRSFRNIRFIDKTVFAMFIAVLVDSIGNHVMHIALTAYLAIIVFALKDCEDL